MNRKTSIYVVAGITAVALLLGLGLASLGMGKSQDQLGNSSTEARADSLAPQIAKEAAGQLGSEWNVSAKLDVLRSYRGNMGLPAWQADYIVEISSKDVPEFRQIYRTTRTFGPGANAVDAPIAPNARIYDGLGKLPAEQRDSLMRGVASKLGIDRLLLIVKLDDGLESNLWASKQSAEHGGPGYTGRRAVRPELVKLAKGVGVKADGLVAVERSADPRISIWGWNGTAFVPVATIDEKTKAIKAWR